MTTTLKTWATVAVSLAVSAGVCADDVQSLRQRLAQEQEQTTQSQRALSDQRQQEAARHDQLRHSADLVRAQLNRNPIPAQRNTLVQQYNALVKQIDASAARLNELTGRLQQER